MVDNLRFKFGENWEEFVKSHFSEERLEISKKCLLEFLELPDLSGKSFIDIGCGSGLSSLAAFKANAAEIISFDIDVKSYETTKKMWELVGRPGNWEVKQGSILDKEFIKSIGSEFDIVYSWGVLHHTGEMWKAIRNASKFAKDNGVFYIAIYNKHVTTPYWIDVKQTYNRSSFLVKKKMEIGYVWRLMFKPHVARLNIAGIKESVSNIRNYKRSRGMEFWTDIKDWLGGWPYEAATREEICQYFEKELRLETMKINPNDGTGNNEFLFRKRKIEL